MKDIKYLTKEALSVVDNANDGLKDLYDQAESKVAKIKLWISLNKAQVMILSVTHFVSIAVGAVLSYYLV